LTFFGTDSYNYPSGNHLSFNMPQWRTMVFYD
jgi:hypothetical protein